MPLSTVLAPGVPIGLGVPAWSRPPGAVGSGGPPSGPAGGDLSGTYPNPVLTNVFAGGSFVFASITVDTKGRITAASNGVPPGGGAPSGPAGGDLTGTYPNPTLVAVVTPGSFTYASITIDAAGRVTAAANGAPPVAPPSTLPPSGPAGGDLAGTYPNPTLAALWAGGTFTYSSITVDSKGRVTAASSSVPPTFPASLPPSGPAGGDLTGTYPNPTLVNVFAGGSFTNSNITVDTKGRITAASNGSAGGGGSGNVNVGVAGQVAYYPTSTADVSPNPILTFTTGLATFDAGTGALPAVQNTGTLLRVGNVDGVSNSLEFLAFVPTNFTGTRILSRVSGGTRAAPAAITGTNSLLTFEVHGYDGTAWSGIQGNFSIIPNGPWTATSHGTSFVWACTPNGSLVKSNVMNLNSNSLNITGGLSASAQVIFGNTSSDYAGQGLLFLRGITKGIRLGTNVNGGYIDGVDNTGITTFQPLAVNGTPLYLQSNGVTIALVNSAGLGVTGSLTTSKVGSNYLSVVTLAPTGDAAVYTDTSPSSTPVYFGQLPSVGGALGQFSVYLGGAIPMNVSSTGVAVRGLVAITTPNMGLTLRTGNDANYLAASYGRAGDEFQFGIANGPGSFSNGTTAGDACFVTIGTRRLFFSINNQTRAVIDNNGLAVTGTLTSSSTFTVSNGNAIISAGNLIVGGDITTSRAAAPTTGALFFGNTSTKYLYYDGSGFSLTANLGVTGYTISAGSGGTSATAAILYLNGGSTNGGGGYMMCQTNGTNQGIFGLNLGIGGGTNDPIIYAYGTNHIFLYGGGTLTADFWNGGMTITGQILATGNITAYYSDDRLKDRLGTIPNALEKVRCLEGFYYQANAVAQKLGYHPVREVGLSAQRMQAVLPEIVAPAPIDPQYLTIHYERVTVLLVEALKELDQEFQAYKLAHP